MFWSRFQEEFRVSLLHFVLSRIPCVCRVALVLGDIASRAVVLFLSDRYSLLPRPAFLFLFLLLMPGLWLMGMPTICSVANYHLSCKLSAVPVANYQLPKKVLYTAMP